ncbi:MAG: glycosyltransferase [Deltaproteobacteria bacterium]|nr:glycosyltransferase [Deltaproteobacteria bacterium]
MGLKKQFDSKRYEPPVIDLSNKNNSHTLLVELTGSNKTVLEVGTSTGYISKILKERGNQVIGIEIDPEAASIAKNYCDQVIVGDIENLDLEGLFEPEYFDVVVLGDVLEHLQWPDVFLGKIKRHLKPTGYLLVSLPNIAHGDVILNLLMGKFQYTDAGLLDKTHFRFFTLKEIAEFFDTMDYQIADLHTTIFELGNTEVDVDWDSVPPEVLRFVKSLPHSNTYQFVFKVYLKEYNLVSNGVSIAKMNCFQGCIPFRDAYLVSLEETLSQIYNSNGWKALRVYYRLRDRFFQEGSQRKRILKKTLALLGKSFLYLKKAIFYWKQFGFWTALSKTLKKLQSPKGNIPFHLHDDESRPEKTNRKIKPAVDILIVTFNSAESIGKCITSLLHSSYENLGEIIIADNHSVDQTIEKIQALVPDARQSIQILMNQSNLGFGRAVNFGANHSRNELLLLLNPDAMVSPNTLSVLVDTMEHFGEKCAAVEARQIPFEHPKLYNPVSLDAVWFSGCCVLLRKAAFQEVGGFDENIFLYAEDVDLSLRLKNAGYAIKYCPKAVVSHEIDPHQARPHQKIYGALSNLYLRAKYGQKLSHWLFSMVGKILHRDMVFPNPLKVFSYLYKGWSNKYPQISNLKGYFPAVGFGYEILRRRGHNVSILPFPHEALVSVVLRTHDRPELLARVLKNLGNQTYEKIEIIIVEDRTKTGLLVVEKFRSLNLRYFHYDGTKGRTGAMNFGLLQARGDWIYCLDDDDVIFADTIETLLYYATHTPSLMAYGGSLELLTDDNWTGILRPGYFQAYDQEKLKRENFIPVGTFLFHRQILEKTGMLDESLEILEDWDFLNRLGQKTDFKYVPKDFLIFLTPLDTQKRLERQRRLDEAYWQVVKKNKR